MRKSITKLLVAGGLALCFSLLLLIPLTGAEAAAPVTPVEPVSEEPPLRNPEYSLATTLLPPPASPTPTSILEVFSILEPPPRQAEAMAPADLGATAAVGLPLLSSNPIFTATNPPSTFSLDWGDMERDGDLDLAIGGQGGVAVYENDGHNNLTELWFDTLDNASFGAVLEVRWADLDNFEPNLELLVVGQSSTGTPQGQSIDYLYPNPEVSDPDSPVSLTFSFPIIKPSQLLRILPGDFNNDDLIDIIVSVNALNVSCPIRYYRNDFFTYPFDPPFDSAGACIIDSIGQTTAALATADFDNDGYLDLALGRYQSKDIQVLLNTGGMFDSPPFDTSNPIPVDSGLIQIPYDLAWGDYDRDGYLDLAAALPIQQEVRIYRNDSGTAFTHTFTIPTGGLLTPLAVDWADFDKDGWLELAVGDIPPKIYKYNGVGFDEILSLPGITGRLQEIRGIDGDNDADLDLALANQFGPDVILESHAPPLESTMQVVTPVVQAQDVAWGDEDGDGYVDLMFGTGDIYEYQEASGDFVKATATFGSAGQDGPLAVGDADGDGVLEAALGRGAAYQVYESADSPGAALETFPSIASEKSLAWGYANVDEYLDLLIGNDNNNGLVVYFNPLATSLTSPPDWRSAEKEQTSAVAWNDYNKDLYMDFAVANGAAGIRVYRNNGNNTFTSVFSSTGVVTSNFRTIAWADYNSDGWPDLATGSSGGPLYLFRSQAGSGEFVPDWNSGGNHNTVSVAWGDWDNDGDFDLAAGNENEKDQVYANLGSPTNPDLTLFWESTEISATTTVAWGDKDGDGDLDLAVSTNQNSGVYENNYVLPLHLTTIFTPALPRNPSYLSISRPGQTRDAYLFSASETLAGPENSGRITFSLTLFDPDSPRDDSSAPGDQPIFSEILYEYSADGGGTWIKTTNVTPTLDFPSRAGITTTVVWNVLADEVVSDDTRFRVTLVHGKPAGPVQRATTRAVSPPFRAWAITCEWPRSADIDVLEPQPPDVPEAGELVKLLGDIQEGEGKLRFNWDFGDGITKTAQQVNHRYDQPGNYEVTLTVEGEPCPITVGAVAIMDLSVGGIGAQKIYLPLILKSGLSAASAAVAGTAPPPPQVAGLDGQSNTQAGATALWWQPIPDQAVEGYHIYRAARAAPEAGFELIDIVPATVQSYTDTTAICGYMYYVTAFNEAGESPPSLASYFSPRCQ